MLINKNLKQYLLVDEEYHSFLNKTNDLCKCFTISEIKDIIFGDINPKAYIYLMKKYGMSFSLASTYIDNAMNLRFDKIHDAPQKILDLVKIYNEIKDFIDPSFRKPILNRGLVFKGDEFDFIQIKKILKDNDISFIEEYDEEKDLKHDVYLYSSKILEVIDTFNYIAELLVNGVSINDINIVAIDSYTYLIKNIATLFGIPYKEESKSLDKTILSNDVYISLKSSGFEASILAAENSDDSLSIKEIKTKIRDIIENMKLILSEEKDNSIIADYYLYNASKTKLSFIKDGISISSNISSCEDKYIFVLGFIRQIIPTFKDDEYLDDELKNKFSYQLTSYEKNDIDKKRFKSKINKAKKIRLSYAKDSFDEVIMAFDNDALFNSVDNFSLKKERYSLSADKFLYASYELNERLYGFKNELGSYLKSFNFDSINSYNNENSFSLKDEIKLKKISYSGLKDYFQCPFKYYCSRVLKLNKEIDSSLPITFGNLVHEKLEKFILNNDEHIERPMVLDIDNLSSSDLYFLNKRIDRFMLVVPSLEAVLKSFASFSKYPEKELIFEIDEEHVFYVKYDLLVENDDFFYIVDYKTGNDSFSLDLAYNGFNMQLPIYLLIAQNCLIGKRSLGAFLHLVGNEKLVLDGLTPEEENLSLYLEENMDFIKGNKRGKAYSLDKETYKDLMDVSKKQVLEAISMIEKGEFKIAPKRIMNKQTVKASSCLYCDYKDICTYKANQINYINLNKEEEKIDGQV